MHGHVYFEAAGVVIAFVLLGKYLRRELQKIELLLRLKS
jgi:cation transport ATPase